MADKVVIDGIDISGCKFYKSNYTEDFNVRIKHYCSIQGGSCAACSDCDFKQNVQIAKQLEEREQECEELKDYARRQENQREVYYKALLKKDKALEEIEEIVKQTCRKRCTNDCLGTKKHCGYGAIFNIINKAKGEMNG